MIDLALIIDRNITDDARLFPFGFLAVDIDGLAVNLENMGIDTMLCPGGVQYCLYTNR